MQNKDKILHDVAKKLDIPYAVVRRVVMSQLNLARRTIQTKQNRSIYIRGVGTFMPEEIRLEIANKKYHRVAEKIEQRKNYKPEEEDPLEFK